MKDGNWHYVYLTRDSLGSFIDLWNPNIGIVKYKGCVYFSSARSLGKRGEIVSRCGIGLIDRVSIWYDRKAVEDQFGFVPDPGTAWLVNTVTLKRKRVDQDMALIDPETGKVVK